jgi:hypothetical protein
MQAGRVQVDWIWQRGEHLTSVLRFEWTLMRPLAGQSCGVSLRSDQLGAGCWKEDFCAQSGGGMMIWESLLARRRTANMVLTLRRQREEERREGKEMRFRPHRRQEADRPPRRDRRLNPC